MSTIRLKLKRIDPLKYAIITSLLLFLISIVFIIPFILIASVGGFLASDTEGIGAFLGGSTIMIIVFPIAYGVIGFIIGLITTALLNLVLKKTGGLDVDFEKSGLDISQIGKLTID